jgi:flagellar biosynthetic protein FliQ
MTQNDIIAIMRDGAYTVLVVSAPLLIVGLLVGLLVSIFQATTSINEQTLTFVPKLIAILVVLILCFGWIMTMTGEFTNRLFEFMATIGQ